MTREEFTSLLKENQEKLDKYENPEDMTLFAMWCTEKVKEENEKLKKQFEVGEEQYNDLVEEKEKLQEQLSSNTLQLEKLKKQVNKGLYNVCLPYKTGYNKAIKDKETQQKEFIKYLENEIKLREEINDIVLATGFEEILQNYKEIIGDVKNEKENIKEISKRFKFKEILDKAVNDMQGTNLYYSKEFVDDIISKLKEKDKEIERLNNIINKGIEAINVYQNEKTLSIGYQDLKRIRGILRGNEFDLKIFEEYLQELKGVDKE